MAAPTDPHAVRDALLDRARAAARTAYAPYSRFAVGAAALSRSGRIHVGTNMENASYGLTMCAEVAALARAVAEGDFQIVALAILGGRIGADGELIAGDAVMPCGRCRQAIKEAADVSGVDIAVFCANADRTELQQTSIAALLPHAFGPKDLGLT